MEEDGETSRRRAQSAACDSEGVAPGHRFHNVAPREHIYMVSESTLYDNLNLTASGNKVCHGGPRCDFLGPVLLMMLLLMCAALQCVLIAHRVSGDLRDDCETTNTSRVPSLRKTQMPGSETSKSQRCDQCVRFYRQTQPGRSPGCPSFWIKINDKCYFFSETQRPYFDSQKDCAERDSRLATVKDETVQDLVALTAQEFWVGISLYNKEDGVWTGVWTDGRMENVTDGIGSCAKFRSGLILENCYTKLRWICQRDTV